MMKMRVSIGKKGSVAVEYAAMTLLIMGIVTGAAKVTGDILSSEKAGRGSMLAAGIALKLEQEAGAPFAVKVSDVYTIADTLGAVGYVPRGKEHSLLITYMHADETGHLRLEREVWAGDMRAKPISRIALSADGRGVQIDGGGQVNPGRERTLVVAQMWIDGGFLQSGSGTLTGYEFGLRVY